MSNEKKTYGRKLEDSLQAEFFSENNNLTDSVIIKI